MKFFLLFAIFVAVLMMGVVSAKKAHFKECAQELGITKEMMQEPRETRDSRPQFRCLSACLSKKSGILEAGNNYNMEKIKEFATKKLGDKAAEVIKGKEDCIAEAKSITDECDFARSVDQCFFKKFPDMMKKPKGAAA